jgi:hypothetical protein
MATNCINLTSSIRKGFATVDKNVRRKTATTHTANRCKQARDNDVRKLKQDIFNLVFVKRHACPASFYERTI